MTRRRHFPALLAILAMALALACSATTEPRVERRVAIIEFHSDPVRIEAPDTVTVGSPFTVWVGSYGEGCSKQGDTELSIEGLLATIRPFDLEVVGPDVVCIAMLRFFKHSVTVRFDQPGTATLRVLGRREPGNESLTVERTLIVR